MPRSPGRGRVARLLLNKSFMGDRTSRESRVLVLEDEAVLRRSLTRLLERRGLMVVAAATVQEAVRRIKRAGGDMGVKKLVAQIKTDFPELEKAGLKVHSVQ